MPCFGRTECTGGAYRVGKTCLAELAIFRLLRRRGEEKLKAVYVAPLKALARERVRDWTPKFRAIGLSVEELTGDSAPDQRALKKADVLITTPEKWDGVTRQFQKRDYARDAALMILDEVHLLGEDRGPVLEALVSRARYTANVRVVACPPRWRTPPTSVPGWLCLPVWKSTSTPSSRRSYEAHRVDLCFHAGSREHV